MSDHVTDTADVPESHSATATEVDEHAVTEPTAAVPFDRDDVAQFEADDSHAGVVLGKMLSAFFLFLLAFMMCVTYWTSQHEDGGADSATVEAPAEGAGH